MNNEAVELWVSTLCYSMSLANGGGLLSPVTRASAQLYAAQSAPADASALEVFSGLSLNGGGATSATPITPSAASTDMYTSTDKLPISSS